MICVPKKALSIQFLSPQNIKIGCWRTVTKNLPTSQIPDMFDKRKPGNQWYPWIFEQDFNNSRQMLPGNVLLKCGMLCFTKVGRYVVHLTALCIGCFYDYFKSAWGEIAQWKPTQRHASQKSCSQKMATNLSRSEFHICCSTPETTEHCGRSCPLRHGHGGHPIL